MPRRFGYSKPPENFANHIDTFAVTDEYINIDLSERVRVPLFDIVYHDSVVSTWRWYFSPDLYSDRKLWDRHDLLYMISGNMPIYALNKDVIPAKGARIVQTYNDCCKWNEKIG